MTSPTYGEVNLTKIADIIREKVTATDDGSEFNLIIGTDSQNFSDTKIVVVIALQHIGHGGLFFYETTRVRRIDNIKQKLITETQMSLEFASKLLEELDKQFDTYGFDYTSRVNFSIHVDAGKTDLLERLYLR